MGIKRHIRFEPRQLHSWRRLIKNSNRLALNDRHYTTTFFLDGQLVLGGQAVTHCVDFGR
jgi:hypothetical protein